MRKARGRPRRRSSRKSGGSGLRRRAQRRLHGLEVVRVRLRGRRHRRRRAYPVLRRPASFFAEIRLHFFVAVGEGLARSLVYVVLELHSDYAIPFFLVEQALLELVRLTRPVTRELGLVRGFKNRSNTMKGFGEL